MKCKTAIVTGASSGIGKKVAAQLAASGANLVVVGRNRSRLHQTAQTIRTLGGSVHVVEADLRRPLGISLAVDEAIARFGTIDILVHAAGVYEPCPLDDLTPESFERTWTTNVQAPLVLTKATLPHMRKSGGAVTFVSSISATVGFANEAAYAGAKAAVEGLTRALAVELAPSGIRVNCVAPGFTETPMNQSIRTSRREVIDAAEACTLAGRLAKAEEIASAVAFLCSDEAHYIYGTVLRVDGGYPTSAIQAGLV